ncbi:Crp/Fnr family transcriptional regulator [Magnetospira sp. QH-2]|uniref:Crp/Fnr family transcriptional regulator n=1 Tax=Magnetospira sp. (strain QH-2) TaxID=1288970 RepID=UPI0003E818D1|nr:Crp/Fnr family transcriptional regulator [Magnetospira sp. QH-2]CCQ75018.1 putative transcriptional regulator, Crp/Fnr family [Magnetospira sp. QH-2]
MDDQAMTIAETLSNTGRTLFAERLIRKHFAKGDGVIERGDPVSGAYFVLDGALRVYTLGPSGKEATLYRIEPGETCVLALNALFNDVLYPAWVDAEADTVIGVLPGPVYRTLFSSETPIQDITVRALSSAVFGLMSELEQRTAQTVEQRLAGYLLLRANGDGKVRNTQQEIAARIGTSREVVGRLMAQFADQGLVKTGRGMVTLVEPAALNDLSGS